MYKRILTVQDISCLGQCSITVALPILSACGHEAVILPSAVLSTHTGCFTGFTFRDLSPDFDGIIKHWTDESIKFDAVYTGYLGNRNQVLDVERIFSTLTNPGAKLICDPAMADHGKLYCGFDGDYVKSISRLCEKSHIILPNITEACLLCGIPYSENITEEYVDKLTEGLHEKFSATVVLTGVGFEKEKTGVLVSYSDGRKFHYSHKRIPQAFHGTGDIYSSAFVGAYMRGFDENGAAKLAADYTIKCIENTYGDGNHKYGVKFETAIPDLINALMLNL